MPPRKNPTTATTQILHPDTTDDLRDHAPLVQRCPDDARILLIECREALNAVVRKVGLANNGTVGILRDRIAKYLASLAS
jgi:hypothetical protein